MKDPGRMGKGAGRSKRVSEILLAAGAGLGFVGALVVLGWFLFIEMPTREAVIADIEAHLEDDPGDHSGRVGRLGFPAGLAIYARNILATAAVSLTTLLVVAGEVACEMAKVPRRERRKLHMVAWVGLAFCWGVIGLVVVLGGW